MDFAIVTLASAFAGLALAALAYQALRLAFAMRGRRVARIARRLYWKG